MTTGSRALTVLSRSQRRAPRGSYRRQRQGTKGLLLVSPALAVLAVFFIVPLGISAWMSLNDWPQLGSHHFSGLANYRRLLHDELFHHSLVFTIEFTLLVTPLLLLLGFFLATAMQHKRRGVSLFRTAVFVPVSIGFVASSYLWVVLLNPSVGIVNRALVDLHVVTHPVNWFAHTGLALGVVVVTTVWKSVGFSMVALMNGLQAIPEEVEEAARVDGAGPMRLLWFIRLPLMRRTIAFVLVFVSLVSMLTFDQFYVFTSGGPANKTATTVFHIYNTAFVQQKLGYAAAMSLVFLLILLLMVIAQLAILRRKDDQ